MTIEVTEEPMTALPEYARVPIAFTVDRVLDVTNHDTGPGGFGLSERRLDVPYEKDYDAIAGEGPLHWARRFDLSNWALFTARLATRMVGGATVAFDTPGLTMLEGRRDLAVLWDIRVSPDALARALALRCSNGSRPGRSCTVVGSSRSKRRIPTHRAAYRELPEEIQLLWYKDLPR
jgi:hypothetical protein